MEHAARDRAIRVMAREIARILSGNEPSVYLYGSCAMDDFRPGWSDIDILVLTPESISPEQAETLVSLRQAMLAAEPENPYYRSFEGGMLSLSAFLTGEACRVVYWGTSGQRIAERYEFDSFCMTELLECGALLRGQDVRGKFRRPDAADLVSDVKRHFETIRKFGASTGRSLYTFGWFLDISRCIYTLRTGRVIAKTAAGIWAAERGLCPDREAMDMALRVRREPALMQDGAVQEYAETLGNSVEGYADVLEAELRRVDKNADKPHGLPAAEEELRKTEFL